MSGIADNITRLRREIPASVTLVAVSKTKSPEQIMEAYNAGQRSFGENRVQEILSKKDLLPADIEWHLIGHLQSNKVKYIVPFIHMIHSVDSLKLLNVINTEAAGLPGIVKCLLQLHIASEETKFGFSMEELSAMFGTGDLNRLKNITICGLMGMATFTDDESLIRNEFRYLVSCFRELKSRYFASSPDFRELSMGMSGDYVIALEEGSTMLRLGSIIFGERN